ncbi:SdrD B-like domain-containing protein [Aeromicrobium sp. P5_D10]
MASLVSLALGAAGLITLTGAPAQAAPGDGTIAVRVVQDYNANGSWDDPFVEPGMSAVEVKVTDPSGVVQNLTTDSDGLLTIVGAPGSYRIEVVNPDTAKYQSAFASEKSGTADTPSATKLSSNEEFVTVAADKTVTVTTGFWEPRDYCQSNPLIVNACQQPIFTPGGALANNDSAQTLFTAPYRAYGTDRGKTQLATKGDTGSVYGIGYRKQDKRIFSAAFAKRGIAYGPGGQGAIYVTSASGGATTEWGTVPNAGTTAHSFDVAGLRQDWDFASAVGKESLGDLDVSEDGDDLQVINLNDRKLYVYDAREATMGAPTHVVDLSANPGCASASDWRPGALGERNGVLYVGGVCSGESSQAPSDMRAIILTFDASTYVQTGTVMDQTINRKRESNAFLAAQCLPRDSADGVSSTSFRPWSDEITCTTKSGVRISDPAAWMDDIVVENNGDLVMAFRDRTGDQQMGANSRYFTETDGTGTLVGVIDYVVAGDINKACKDDDGDFLLDINGGCGIAAPAAGQRSGEFFTGDGGVHAEEAYGGIALSRGERGIVTSAMDPIGIFTQGYFRVDRETGRPIYSADGGTSPTSPETLLAAGGNTGGNRISAADTFSKGQGMADMEVLCDLAPIQIGNRVWTDSDKDGVQDAGEAGIAGVTVNLYDSAGTLVATTVTNSRGEYYFDSINDGVEFNTDYTIRLDKAADYEDGEPLDSAVNQLTEANSGSGAGADRVDSDGTLVDGFPEYKITTGDRGDVDHTFDFGFKPKSPPSVSVGDYVWFDQDKDGVQDSGEDGIEGVVLKLTGPDGDPVTDVNGNPVGPVTTDADGKYSFDDLPPLPAGQHYTVTIDKTASATALEGFSPTKTGEGTGATDSSTDSAESGDLTSDGDRDSTLDFGFIKPAVSVGDYVWYDDNKDGIQDAGEDGIEGVVLVLTGPDGSPVVDINGDPVGPVTTDADGKYSFDDLPVLPAGQHYTVTIDKTASAAALTGFVPTKTGEGTGATDSSTDSAESGDLTSDGDRDSTLDFGFSRPSVSVGDYVWLDKDKDGVQDAGEDGIDGVVLKLTGPDGNPVTDVDGNPVGPVTTDGDGKYTFANLPPLSAGESYTVTIDKAASATALQGLSPTKTGEGTPGTDSSTDSAVSGDLTTDGASDPTLDFGFTPDTVSVGDFVWLDNDRDGVQDAGEPGVPDVVLVLTGPDGNPVTDVDGNPVGPVTTGADGKYNFANLPPLPAGEHYTVTIDKTASADALKGFTPTKTGEGTPGTDSSTDSAESGDLTKAGDSDNTLDFGFVTPAVSVGDFVWLDDDRDGVQDAGEDGIQGVVLKLTGPDGNPVTDVFGNPVGPVTTGLDGKYSFDDLPALPAGQHYTVTIDKAASADALKPFIPTKTGEGTPGTDSSTDSAESGDLTSNGDRDSTLDFGFVRPKVSVGDFVWIDKDRDGIQDSGEPGVKGVVLKLTGPDGKPVTDIYGMPVGSVTTDANGKYSFDNLPTLKPGESYKVTIDQAASAKALKDFVPTKAGQGDRDKDSSTWSASSGDLTDNGDRDSTLDFGFVQVEEVAGTVWVDKDKDGKVDKNEPRLPGVVVIIKGPDGKPVTDVHGNVVEPVTTGKDGKYSFKDLPKLPDGQSYTTVIDKEASKDALAGYSVSPVDPLNPMDFGFVPKAKAAPAPGKAPDDDESGILPDTGSPSGILALGGLGSLLRRRLVLFGFGPDALRDGQASSILRPFNTPCRNPIA